MEKGIVKLGGWNGLDLRGYIIQKIYIGGDDNILVIKTDKGIYYWQAEGDCCSQSFISDIIRSPGLSYRESFECIDIVEMDLDNVPVEPTLQAEDKLYGYEIVGEKGSLYITYRNSSNGYYGGRLEFMGKVDWNIELLFEVEGHFISMYV